MFMGSNMRAVDPRLLAAAQMGATSPNPRRGLFRMGPPRVTGSGSMGEETPGTPTATSAVPSNDNGTLARKGMPMIESRMGTAARQNAPAMPGPISGYGGGTFNMDGSQATPVDHWSIDADGQTAGAPMRSAPSDGMAQGGPLGGSMRQPFDYEAAKAILAGEKPKIKDWQKVLAVLADMATAAGGGQPYAMRNIMARQDDYSKRQFEAAKQILGWQHGDYEAQIEADLRAANPFTIGRERLGYDPATGQVDVLYQGRQDGEIYADSLGFDRGSEEWNAALEDYILRSSGPSAHQRDMEIDDYRTANDRSLEGYRQQNRLQMEGARQGNRRGMVDYRNANPPPSRAKARPTARNAKGERIEWDGKKWVPVK